MFELSFQKEQNEFDSTPHFKFLEEVLKEKTPTVLPEKGSPYPWMGKLEDERLAIQNERTGANCWTEMHSSFLRKINQAGFNPESIAMIGTGKDAILIPDAFIFPKVKKATVIELMPDKIAGAKETLKNDNFNLDSVDFISGNAAEELPKLGKFDVIDTQLFEQHLFKKPPFLTPEDKKENFPTFEKLLKARVDALKPGGLLTTSDLIINEWRTVPTEGFEDDPEVQELIKKGELFIHGDEEKKVPGFIKLGWDARGASAWKSGDEIVEAITNASQGKLKFLPELSMVCDRDYKEPSNRARINTETAYIVAMIAFAVQTALMTHKKALESQPDNLPLKGIVENLSRGAEFLHDKGSEYIEMLKDERISVIIPPMHYLAFQKNN
jgi:SAM-dependent methyltransferase